MKKLVALTLGLLAYFAFPAFDGGVASAAPVRLQVLLEAIDPAVWTRTYEGFALVDRAIGRPMYHPEDLAEVARGLEGPAHRAQLPELQDRLLRIENAYRAGEGTWAALARVELSQAPLRAREAIEFVPAEATQYERLRDAFLIQPTWGVKGEIVRDVQVFLRGEYRLFQNDLLARVEALGMVVKPNYRNATVLVGRAPERALRAMSGIDGVSRVHALGRSAREPRNGMPATPRMAPLDYIRGVNARSS
jgi:hypothetical protein